MDYENLPEQLNVNEKLMKKTKFRLISFFFIIAIDIYLLILHQSKPLFFFKMRPATESISSYGSYQMILWILMVFVILFFVSYVLLLNAYFKSDQMPKNKYQKIYNFFDLFTVVPVFFMLVMIVNGWFFTTAVVYQDSMNNTYFENDFVFINYRESIDEDDVIIFEKDKLYIKRIIGMPGDELIVNQSGVYLNGTMISSVPVHQGYDVFIFDGVIPENQYFVMGDNREVSVDSRYASLGFVDADEIIGGVMFEHEKERDRVKQIQWYPGHMAKAKRLIEEKLKLIDVVYELVDARIPESSRNPMMDDITNHKDKILILNKADLADPNITQAWATYYEQENIPYVICNSLNDQILQDVYQKTKKVLKHLHDQDLEKGRQKRHFKAMVIGVPNVGKSQFINNLAGKNKVKTGNIPGITKTQSFIKAQNDLLLFDNPGVLWPKFSTREQAFRLALMGTIKDALLPLDEVTIFGIEYLREHYPQQLTKRYGFDIDPSMSTIDIIDQIGMRRGAKLSGNEIDYDRVFNLFLYDLRQGALGALSFERPE